jgi:Ca2+-binding EF-hand superfamily protein
MLTRKAVHVEKQQSQDRGSHADNKSPPTKADNQAQVQSSTNSCERRASIHLEEGMRRLAGLFPGAHVVDILDLLLTFSDLLDDEMQAQRVLMLELFQQADDDRSRTLDFSEFSAAVSSVSFMTRITHIELVRAFTLWSGPTGMDSERFLNTINQCLCDVIMRDLVTHFGEVEPNSTKMFDSGSSSEAQGKRFGHRQEEEEVESDLKGFEYEMMLSTEVRKLFDAYDADGSGSIDSDEFNAMLASLGHSLPPQEVSEMLKVSVHTIQSV